MLINLLLTLILLFIIFLCFLGVYFFVKLMIYRVPFVPTPKKVAKKMIELADIKSKQKIYDLGCGGGIILFEAEKKYPDNKFCGYEVLRPAVIFANTKKIFKKSKINFKCQDFFAADLSDADVIFCYLFPSIMEKFYEKKFSTLKKGTKIISHGFKIKNLQYKKKVVLNKAKIWIYEKS